MTMRRVGRRRFRFLFAVGAYTGLVISLAVFLFPLLWIVGLSFKTRMQTFASPPLFIWTPTLQNYITVLETGDFQHAFVNSLVISAEAVLLSMAVGVPAAYGFARFRFSGDRGLFFSLLVMRMLPPIAVLVPMYVLFSKLGLAQTRISVVLAYTTFSLPLVVWIMRGFFEELPRELEESAWVDGASKFAAFRAVALPLVRPGMVAATILCLLLAWNDFIFAAGPDNGPDTNAAGVDGELFGRCGSGLGGDDGLGRAGGAAGYSVLFPGAAALGGWIVIGSGERVSMAFAGISRRAVLAGSGAVVGTWAARAQTKPDKLVYVGDSGPWHWCLQQEVAPAFEKATGIKVDFTLLPGDALTARLKAELSAGSTGIDIVQWNPNMAGWVTRHMQDHAKLLANLQPQDFDWEDFLPAVQQMATYDGKLSGIPYRVITDILFYQRPVLEQAGVAKAPESFGEFLAAAEAVTKQGLPHRYGTGFIARQGSAILDPFTPILRSAGGDFYDPKTGEIFINKPAAVEALKFYGELMSKYHLMNPDSLTWEFDGVISGGQNDQFGMSITIAPYGELMNDPKQSKTSGKWAFAPVPGRDFDQPEPDASWRMGAWGAGRDEAYGVGVRFYSAGDVEAMVAAVD